MKLSDLQSKKIIDTINGISIGIITDLNISKDGTIETIIVDQGKSFLTLNKESNLEIPWSCILKIGEDVILVKKE